MSSAEIFIQNSKWYVTYVTFPSLLSVAVGSLQVTTAYVWKGLATAYIGGGQSYIVGGVLSVNSLSILFLMSLRSTLPNRISENFKVDIYRQN